MIYNLFISVLMSDQDSPLVPEEKKLEKPFQLSQLLNGSTLLGGLRMLTDFKKKTLVSDIFNYELG